ncbi:hypothetical protein QQY66_38850 [Streptomyces sp. DG2A-72]|uniref:hypothetical protein n=1 Tax=Streptomyces sp. DG2A-72 TaxID=3051386 RepID=UPI00265C88A9|nr:hypothetical protein [Streptomyces sp. DG2A-72]MDO0937400.1 hypothetical protein [Streptomyces sp. DG2A-72]
MSENRDDLNSSPSPTEEKQAELRRALYINDGGDTQGGEPLPSNTVALLNSVMTRRNMYETERLIAVVERAKQIAVEHAAGVM